MSSRAFAIVLFLASAAVGVAIFVSCQWTPPRRVSIEGIDEEGASTCYTTARGKVCDDWAWDLVCRRPLDGGASILHWTTRRGAELRRVTAAADCWEWPGIPRENAWEENGKGSNRPIR